MTAARKPPIAVILAGVLLTAGQVANQLVLAGAGDRQWRDLIVAVIALATTYGIPPLAGASFDQAVGLTRAKVAAIAVALTTATGVLTILALPIVVHATLAGAITLASTLVLGTTTAPAATARRAKRSPRT